MNVFHSNFTYFPLEVKSVGETSQPGDGREGGPLGPSRHEERDQVVTIELHQGVLHRSSPHTGQV